jgi:hypothetical protein
VRRVSAPHPTTNQQVRRFHKHLVLWPPLCICHRGEAGTAECAKGTRKANVLKITINQTPTEERWILQGRLVGPWVDELRTSWKKTHRTHGGTTRVLDLSDVSFIDKAGERLLRTMFKQGAKLVADGMYIKHVLEQLKANGVRGSIALMVCLFAGLQTSVVVSLPSGRGRPACMETRVKEGTTMAVELMDAIDGANATRASADRTAQTEDQ